MKTRRINFTSWEPDVSEVNGEGVFRHCRNAWPSHRGYEAAWGWVDQGARIAATSTDVVTGMGHGVAEDENHITYLAISSSTTSSALWEMQAATSSSVTDYRSGYLAATDVSGTSYSADDWRFVQWEGDILAASFKNKLQKKTITDLGTNFSDLSSQTSAPKAKDIAVARNFVITGYTWDATDSTSPYRVRWSAINDPTDWDVSAATQADYNDLSGAYGIVQRVFGGEYGVVFQQKAIWRMTYVGPPLIWQFDEIVTGSGLFHADSAVQVDNKIFYLTEEGFHVLLNGSESRPIGYGRVDEYVRSLYKGFLFGQLTTMQSVVDPLSHRVFFADPNRFSDMLVYDFVLNKWGACDIVSDSKTETAKEVASFGNHKIGVFARKSTLGGQVHPNFSIGIAGRQVFDGGTSEISVYGLFAPTSRQDTRPPQVGTNRLELSPGRNSLVTSVTLGYEQWDGKDVVDADVTPLKTIGVTVRGYESSYEQIGTAASSTITATSDPNVETKLPKRFSSRKNGRFHELFVQLDPTRRAALSIYSVSVFPGDVISWADIEYVESHKR